MSGSYQIPFDGDGNQLHFGDNYMRGIEWRDNAQFKTAITYDSFTRGRSAAFLVFKTSEGREVTVFLTDFEAMVPHMVKGTVKGTFAFTKRGQNFGCKLVEASS